MPAIQGYSIKHVSGTQVTVGPGSAVTNDGTSISHPKDIVIDVATDTEGPLVNDSMLAIYVVEDGGKTIGKASGDFFWKPASGKFRRIGAVRLTPAGVLAEAFQTASGQVRPTKYTDPANDTQFVVTKSTAFKAVDLSAYTVDGGDVELAITVSASASEVQVKGANGVTTTLIGGGVISVTTNPHGEAEFKPMHEDVKVTVLSFQDVV
ncbi:MAG: hypothetical protein EP330_24230 [Deltaproteobacteria bacterium]|nr:MAG: hypothetical protein EP330_24230 [Deltaproteobacteria bacterium]